MPRSMLMLAAAAIVIYIVCCALLFLYQRTLIYFPQPPSPGGIKGARLKLLEGKLKYQGTSHVFSNRYRSQFLFHPRMLPHKIIR